MAEYIELKRPTDISFDIETLGNRADAAILSIGAASFNRNTGRIGACYQVVVKLDQALRFGRVGPDTLAWWMEPERARAREVFLSQQKNAVTLYEALRGLNDFIRTQMASVCVWGNGSSFDISILEHGYDAVGMPGFREQWEFWSVRDMRTALDMSGFDKKTIPFTGTPHNAMDDAIHQAKIIAACFAKLRGTTFTPPVEDDDL